jgi:hypothetical protein
MELLRNKWKKWTLLLVAAILIEKPLAYLFNGMGDAVGRRNLEKFIGPDLIVIYALVALIVGVYKQVVKGGKHEAIKE